MGSSDTHYEMRGEDSVHNHHISQPPLSPRLHSLPDNVLSPLGLLAEASLQNTDGKKAGPAAFNKTHRPSPLSLDGRAGSNARGGQIGGAYRTATSDVRGGNNDEHANGGDDGHGVASQNYFRPGASVGSGPIVGDNRVSEGKVPSPRGSLIKDARAVDYRLERRDQRVVRNLLRLHEPPRAYDLS
jgi:hypothetical protein